MTALLKATHGHLCCLEWKRTLQQELNSHFFTIVVIILLLLQVTRSLHLRRVGVFERLCSVRYRITVIDLIQVLSMLCVAHFSFHFLQCVLKGNVRNDH